MNQRLEIINKHINKLRETLTEDQQKELEKIFDILWVNINEIDTRVTLFRGLLNELYII